MHKKNIPGASNTVIITIVNIFIGNTTLKLIAIELKLYSKKNENSTFFKALSIESPINIMKNSSNYFFSIFNCPFQS